jgi:hypothetical protein
MTPPDQTARAYVLVIDREVYRGMSARDVEAVRQAMASGVESVTFTAAGRVVRARIAGVEVAWAPERRATTSLVGDLGSAGTVGLSGEDGSPPSALGGWS